MRQTLRQGALLWLGIAFICFLLGAFDDIVLFPRIGEIAIPITGIAMCIVIFLIILFALPKLERTTAKGYWMLGALWLVMTIIFECADGILLEHASLAELLAAYNPTTGNLWLLVILVMFFSPIIVMRIKRLNQ